MNTQIRKYFKTREIDPEKLQEARKIGFSPLQSRIIAGRASDRKLDYPLKDLLYPSLKKLHHPELLRDCVIAADKIVEAVATGCVIGILTDYDVDGICSHVVVRQSLLRFGVPESKLISLIGHRINDGYGISGGLVEKILALDERPQLIITADCGSSDELQISRLKEKNIAVVITDHHSIPASGIPVSAEATVNPARKDCTYPDKYISGCMVVWLLMCLVRKKLIEQEMLEPETEKLGWLLDFVGLSTIADAVTFVSPTNRTLVSNGLKIINQFNKPSWAILAKHLGKNKNNLFTVDDLAYQVAPRINARSRMADPYAALNFFVSPDQEKAFEYLQKLEKNNEERKLIERNMVKIARRKAVNLRNAGLNTLVIFEQKFHAGVQGIVASRLVESFGMPCVVLSPLGNEGLLSGSARTVSEVDLYKVLQKINESQPGLLKSFGGHKGAAGIKINRSDIDLFSKLFEKKVVDEIQHIRLEPYILTDGILETEMLRFETINEIQKLAPFGRDFEEPTFMGVFEVAGIRAVGAESIHLSLNLKQKEKELQAIWFNALNTSKDKICIECGNTIRCAYKLKLNMYNGRKKIQLLIEYAEPE